MRIIYKNEPLLFVHGPPIYIRVATTDEESTSVFVLNEEETEEFIEGEEEVQETTRTNSEVFNKITSLGSPFQRQVYKPLQFVFENEVLKGVINRIDGETLFIELVDEEDLIVAVDINTIKDVLWRGKPFQEK
ncbi:hypothetical protein JSQ81_18170 [Sporosarcina sp. Marseille-Q4063]|uniref:hypothetical protein n=1 Tax=Sporosarcina sp. Marseille-Q4063 TaxID=2810514 RepID=UPI001BB032B5|nr:hypothetical protein [Sporosarcina sp. Marseille-Q4063]QUW21685.1 hypothetical protein JSQ81_18170 [Sporosarcina sp. Marseille-Q4063]